LCSHSYCNEFGSQVERDNPKASQRQMLQYVKLTSPWLWGVLHGEQKKFWPKSSNAEKCLLGWMLHATAFTPTFSHLH